MAGWFGSSMCRTWVIEEEDEEDEDDFLLLVDDDELEVVELFDLQNAESSRHIHRLNGPSKLIRPRDHAAGDARIRKDYFGPNPVYSVLQFRRRFRMRVHVFERIVEAIKAADPYFTQKEDAIGRLGLTGLQKAVASIRILAYGLPVDATDEYVRIAESTARKAFRHFCRAIISVFGKYYLRAPNAADVARLLRIGEERGFPGSLGSIDCMHWPWRNCPARYKGMFKSGHAKHPSMILEAVASHDLWIWHAYFGMPGSCNDINVLQRSPVFSPYLKGQAAPVSFTVNGHTYDMGYYLADGIYPNWSAFVKTISNPIDMKAAHFAKQQESVRKDIERAFGVLQSRWAIVRGPAYGFHRGQISDIMTTCIILHNMIIEDEGKLAKNTNYDDIGVLAIPFRTITQERSDYIKKHHKLKNPAIHSQLQMDLIEHHWMRHGSRHGSS